MTTTAQTTETRIETFTTTLAKATAKLRRTDRAAAEALLAAGQQLVEQIRRGAL